MATIDNYIGAIEYAAKSGDFKKQEEARTALKEFVREFSDKQVNRYMGMYIKEKTVQDGSAILDFDGMMPDDDKVNNPSHYQSMVKDLNIDCITAMRAAFGDYETAVFCKLNTFKYIFRSSSKGGNTDIQKAQWYLNKFLELGGEEQITK